MNGRYWISLVLALLASGVAWAADPPAAPQEQGYLQPSFAIAADFSPVYPTSVFPVENKGATVVFRLSKGESIKTLTGTWQVVQKGALQTVRDLAKSELKIPTGAERGWFSYYPPGGLPVGSYRFDVAADGRPWKSADFEIVAAAETGRLTEPDTLMPMTLGTVWEYELSVKGGEGVKITAPESATVDADGVYHLMTHMTVAGVDDAGIRIDMGEKGKANASQWLQWGRKGLLTTQQKQGDEVGAFNPPQVLLPRPLRSNTQWTWYPKDGSEHITYRVWGPVPVKGPNGEAPGYVTVAETKEKGGSRQTVTDERHFLPGVGMVREIVVTGASNNKLVSRQELTLKTATLAKGPAIVVPKPVDVAGVAKPVVGQGTGLKLDVAEWVPARNEDYGWWGVALAGEPGSKPVRFLKTGDKLIVEPGRYDVYWVQDYDTRNAPMLLAGDVEVKAGELTRITADSGVMVDVASWVPARDKDYGWFGASRAGQAADKPVNWSKAADVLLLPPGRYDVYWVQDYDVRNIPMKLASNLEVESGKLAEVAASSGVKISVAKWAPARDKDYGWFGASRAGEAADKHVNWSKTADTLLVPPGRYDLYWVQDYDVRNIPMKVASNLEVEPGKLVEASLGSGVRLSVASWVPARDKDYGWWGASRAGEPATKLLNWSKTADTLLLTPGRYDVYWVQNYDTRNIPVSLTSNLEVKEGEPVVVTADSGLRLTLPEGTPALDKDYGWWGVVTPGGEPNKVLQWSKGAYDKPLVLAPGRYDVFWKQDYDSKPRRILRGVVIEPGRLLEAVVTSTLREAVTDYQPAGAAPRPAAVEKPAAPTAAGESVLQTALAAAADFSPVYPTDRFSTTGREVIATFRLGEKEAVSKLTSKWIAVDVGASAPANFEFGAGDLEIPKDKRQGMFRYSQPGPMPAGKYRIDVLADGKPWRSATFTVAGPAAGSDMREPKDLMPMAKGTVWTYALELRGSKAAKVSLPGVTPDADGALRGTFTMTVADEDATGTRIESRLNGRLTAEEWWRLGADGLVATQRRAKGDDGDTTLALDPPQVMFPLPVETPKSWTYETKDGTVRQAWRVWGPVPVQGPSGPASGYVVMIEEQLPFGMKRTVEREVLPGAGFVREVIIVGAAGDTVSRQEIVLKSVK